MKNDLSLAQLLRTVGDWAAHKAFNPVNWERDDRSSSTKSSGSSSSNNNITSKKIIPGSDECPIAEKLEFFGCEYTKKPETSPPVKCSPWAMVTLDFY